MNEYRPIYRLSIEHDYFKDKSCRGISVRIASPGMELMRRRGLLLRQTAVNEWTLLCRSGSAGVDPETDVLTFDLHLTDPAFPLFTDWQAFEPQKSYSLRLPAETPEASEAILQTDGRGSIGAGFCKAELHFTAGMPDHDLLRFHARKFCWEYFFIARNGDFTNGSGLALREAKGLLGFTGFEPVEFMGGKAWRTVSEEPVAVCESYGYQLSLQEETARSHIVRLRNVPHPLVGNHLGAPDGVLRQVCYF